MASAYFYRGSIIESLTSTPTSGGNLALSNASDHYQILTGTLAHTVTMPDATTLALGIRYEITNASTQDITVNDFGGNLLGTVASGSTRIFRAADISSANGSWDVSTATSSGTGLSANDAAQLAILSSKGFSAQSRFLKLSLENQAGNFWTTKQPVSVAKCWPTNFTLNGYVYNAFGVNNSSVNTVTNERYDTDNNFFLSRANGITAANTRMPLVLGGFGYAVNGDPSINAVERYDDVNNSWSSRTAIGTAMYGAGSWVLGDYGFISGGQGSGTTTFSYDATNNAWYTKVAVPVSTTRSGQGDGVLNGYGYLISGTATAVVRKYDHINNVYSVLTNNLNIGHAMGGVAAISGWMIASGGENVGGTPTTTVERYSDAYGYWLTVAPNTQARYGCGAQFANSFMHISNGIGTGVAYTTVESYTPFMPVYMGALKVSTAVPASIAVSALLNNLTPNIPVQLRTDGDNWKSFQSGGTPLKTGESLSAKFRVVDKVFIAGGSISGTSTNAVREFDDNSNAWTSRTNLTVGLRYTQQFNIDGIGYMPGGFSTVIVNTNYAFNDILGSWTTKNPLPENRESAACFSILGYGYLSGGYVAGVVNTMRKYNPTLDSWSTLTNLDSSLDLVGSNESNDMGYRFGGTSNDNSGGLVNTAARYNPISDSWSSIANIASAKGGMATASIDGYPVISGAFTSGSPGSATERYSQTTNSWTTMTSMPGGKAFAASGKANGYLFNIGGTDGSASSANYRFNPSANTWSTRTALPSATNELGANAFFANPYRNYELRLCVPAYYAGTGSYQILAGPSTNSTKSASGHACLNGNPFAFGGGSATSEYLNVDINSWTQFAVSGASGSVTGGWVLNGQAYHISDLFQTAFTAAADFYTRTWTSRTAPGNYRGRTGQGNGISLNGYGYITGGDDTGAGFYTNTERYNPSTNSWNTSVGNLQTSQNCRTPGSQRVNGQWLLFGGYGATFPSNTNNVELYSDVTQAWVSKNTYPINAIGIGAITIDNNVVTIGGYNGSNLSNMYRYVPETDSWLSLSSFTTTVSDMSTESVFGTMTGSGSTNSYRIVSSVKQAIISAGLTVT